MPTVTSVPLPKVPGDDEEMPDAAPADQASHGPVTVGPAVVDPVITEVTKTKDEPMTGGDSDGSSSPPAIPTTGDAQTAPPAGSTAF
eukprot:14139141-Alexandrium_andersonii.AAC.1